MVKINTTQYVNEWARNPKGYGLWVFKDIRTGERIEVTGTYTEAKKQVTQYLRNLGVRDVELVLMP